MKIPLTGLLPDDIIALLPGEKKSYRGMQIFRWIHERCVESFDEMTNLSKSFRADLAQTFSIGCLTESRVLRSSDTTTDKFLWTCADGAPVESVIIRDEDRTTACVSSQVGCAMACAFCRTGTMGFIRDLTSGEIVDQLISMRRRLRSDGEDITNIVFMGMGEPLANLDAVLKAIRIITLETGMCIGQRKITVSTCGLIPGIDPLSRASQKIGLAVSLNAPDDALRDRLMPINRRYPIGKLFESLKNFYRSTSRRVTFEYILIGGVNDTPAHARALLSLIRRVPSKVNLIAFNEYEDSPFRRSSDAAVAAFQRILVDGNVTAMLRKSKGTDILAACGQLASQTATTP